MPPTFMINMHYKNIFSHINTYLIRFRVWDWLFCRFFPRRTCSFRSGSSSQNAFCTCHQWDFVCSSRTAWGWSWRNGKTSAGPVLIRSFTRPLIVPQQVPDNLDGHRPLNNHPRGENVHEKLGLVVGIRDIHVGAEGEQTQRQTLQQRRTRLGSRESIPRSPRVLSQGC